MLSLGEMELLRITHRQTIDMKKTIYSIALECPCEESLIKAKLRSVAGITDVAFDMEGGKVMLWHEGDASLITSVLEPLGMEAKLLSSETISPL